MSRLNMELIKEKYISGVNAVNSVVNNSKDIYVHPKFSASISVSSKKNKDIYFNKGIKIDKELTLWNIICIVLAAVAALTTATIIINSIFSAFTRKKKSNSDKTDSDCA